MADEYQRRCLAVQQALAARGIDYLVVTPSSDLIYLTGIDIEAHERLLALILPSAGKPVLLLPRLEATKLADMATFAVHEVWEDADDPMALLAGLLGSGGSQHPVVAVSEQMMAGVLLRLQAALPQARFVRGQPLLAEQRLVKSQAEIDLLRAAARMADETFARLLRERLAGKTERAVADLLSRLMRRSGLEKASFVIVASGANGAAPHHVSGERRLQEGDVVVLDFGGTYRHYQCDITRTIAIGEPPCEAAQVHAAVRQAQEAAFRTVRPGVTAGEVDEAARRHLVAAGLGEYFIHRTGHGLGLDVHEEPYIVHGSHLPLREGMVFSIEPGVYLPGRFGVRVEDIVVVTAEGAERLNNATRELVTVSPAR